MHTTHTVDFTTPEQASLVLGLLNAGAAYRNGTLVEMDDEALHSLAELAATEDGHYDGARIWIASEVGSGRHSYRVDTERA